MGAAVLEPSCCSKGPKQAGGVGQQEPWGVQEGQMRSPLLATEETPATIKAGDWLGSSSAEKELEVLVDTNRT